MAQTIFRLSTLEFCDKIKAADSIREFKDKEIPPTMMPPNETNLEGESSARPMTSRIHHNKESNHALALHRDDDLSPREARQVQKMTLTASDRSTPSQAFGYRVSDLLRRDAFMRLSSSLLSPVAKHARESSRERIINQARLVKRQLGALSPSSVDAKTLYKKRKIEYVDRTPRPMYSAPPPTRHRKRPSRAVFRFADLPVELRCMICGFSFAQFNGEGKSSMAPLLRALKINKTLYVSAKEVYLKENVFHFEGRKGWGTKFLDCLSTRTLEKVKRGRVVLYSDISFGFLTLQSQPTTIALCVNLTHLTLALPPSSASASTAEWLAYFLRSRLYQCVSTIFPLLPKLRSVSLILEYPVRKDKIAYHHPCSPLEFFKKLGDCRAVLDRALGCIGRLEKRHETEKERRKRELEAKTKAGARARVGPERWRALDNVMHRWEQPRWKFRDSVVTVAKYAEETRQVWVWEAEGANGSQGKDAVFKVANGGQRHIRFE